MGLMITVLFNNAWIQHAGVGGWQLKTCGTCRVLECCRGNYWQC